MKLTVANGSCAFSTGNVSVPFGRVVSRAGAGGGAATGAVPGVPNVLWVIWLSAPFESRVFAQHEVLVSRGHADGTRSATSRSSPGPW